MLGAARLGARVRMLCRDPARGERARAEIQEVVPDADLVVDQCDLSDLGSVRTCAGRLCDELPAIHALVHNAGVMAPARTETADGHELTVATHVLGPHLLTARLRPALAADADARVVFVSSGGMYAQRLRTDDPEFHEGEFDPTTAYARTKRMQVVLAQLWAARLADQHVAVHAMHPGWADTAGVTDSLPALRKDRRARSCARPSRAPTPSCGCWPRPSRRARPACSGTTGGPRPTSYVPFTRHTKAEAATLWDYCEVATR